MDNRTRGVVASVDYTTGLCTVTVAGVTISAQAVGQLPIVGAEAYVEKRGEHRTDWVITDVQNPTDRVGIGCGRYSWAKTAVLGASVFSGIGDPPTTPWSTGATVSNHSRLTIIRDCFVGMWATCTGDMILELTFLSGSQDYPSSTQSGGVSREGVSFAGLVITGEVIDILARSVGATTMVAKSYVTFTDAFTIAAQT